MPYRFDGRTSNPRYVPFWEKLDKAAQQWLNFDTQLAGKHIWRGKHHMPTTTFCSDELKEAFDSAGMKKWGFFEAYSE